MRLPTMEDSELIRQLRVYSEEAFKIDGDRDHMNGSGLTCKHTQVMAKLMTIVSNRLEQTLLASRTLSGGAEDVAGLATRAREIHERLTGNECRCTNISPQRNTSRSSKREGK